MASSLCYRRTFVQATPEIRCLILEALRIRVLGGSGDVGFRGFEWSVGCTYLNARYPIHFAKAAFYAFVIKSPGKRVGLGFRVWLGFSWGLKQTYKVNPASQSYQESSANACYRVLTTRVLGFRVCRSV